MNVRLNDIGFYIPVNPDLGFEAMKETGRKHACWQLRSNLNRKMISRSMMDDMDDTSNIAS